MRAWKQLFTSKEQKQQQRRRELFQETFDAVSAAMDAADSSGDTGTSGDDVRRTAVRILNTLEHTVFHERKNGAVSEGRDEVFRTVIDAVSEKTLVLGDAEDITQLCFILDHKGHPLAVSHHPPGAQNIVTHYVRTGEILEILRAARSIYRDIDIERKHSHPTDHFIRTNLRRLYAYDMSLEAQELGGGLNHQGDDEKSLSLPLEVRLQFSGCNDAAPEVDCEGIII